MMGPFETSAPQRFRRRLLRWVSAGTTLLALVTTAGTAAARPEFPELIQNAFEPVLACPPPCVVCHTSPTGGSENAEQPFAVNIVLAIGSLNESNVKLAVAALGANPCKRTEDPACLANPMMCGACDADGDGVTDVEELRAGTNPNPGGADLKCPEYGCGARIAPARANRRIDGKAALAALGTLVVLAGFGRRAAKRRRA